VANAGWKRTAGLLVALAAAGCACADMHCGVDAGDREFGARTRRWAEGVLRVPPWLQDEAAHRTDLLAEYRRTWRRQRGHELARTAAVAAGTGPWLAGEFTDRAGSAWGWLARQGQRTNEDACCFLERSWHTLKLALE